MQSPREKGIPALGEALLRGEEARPGSRVLAWDVVLQCRGADTQPAQEVSRKVRQVCSTTVTQEELGVAMLPWRLWVNHYKI